MAGRKSLKEEVKVIQYLAELSEPTFKIIKDCLTREYSETDSDETRRIIRTDKKWAAEQMAKLYAKCIPQAGDDDTNPIFTKQITGMEIIDDRPPGDTKQNPVQDKKS